MPEADHSRPLLARLPVQIAVSLAAFGVGVGIAEAAGAKNLGVAFGVGQICFAIACVYCLLRG